MILDEAIQHCEEVAKSKTKQVENGDWEKGSSTERDCIACASEHQQLAEWLKELKAYKENTCGDAISRQAVLDIINFEDKWLLDAKEHNVDTKMAFWVIKSKISELTSVSPQQRMGRWVKEGQGGRYKWMCSNCGTHHRALYDYCPSCGAKMEVEE